jgi:cell wall-associated NlpC family hydrolase
MSMSAALALTISAGQAAADPGPSARDIAKSRQDVRERAAAVGRTKARLAQAGGELERLAATAELAMENYNGEVVRVEQARQAYEHTQVRVAQAEQRYQQTRAEAAVFAASAYRSGTGASPWAAAMTGPRGPQDFMDRAALVEVLAHRQAGVMERVQAAKTIADMFRRQAQSALYARQAAAERAEAAKRAATALVAAQRSQIRRIKSREAVLLARLGEARAHAARLRRAREQAQAAHFRGGSARGSVVVRAALKWLGTPYSWGGGTVSGPSFGIGHGAGTRGFDCSGLALHAWNKAGVRLDHWTGTQWTSGPHVPTSMLRPGDLVFFARDSGDPKTIHHVGIYIGRGLMVEAPYSGARVRISSIWRGDLIGATRPAG